MASKKLKRKIQRMPGFVRDALASRGLTAKYKARPPYQRNDYVLWINSAKLQATKLKRLNQMLTELRTGGVYMKAKWNG